MDRHSTEQYGFCVNGGCLSKKLSKSKKTNSQASHQPHGCEDTSRGIFDPFWSATVRTCLADWVSAYTQLCMPQNSGVNICSHVLLIYIPNNTKQPMLCAWTRLWRYNITNSMSNTLHCANCANITNMCSSGIWYYRSHWSNTPILFAMSFDNIGRTCVRHVTHSIRHRHHR